VATLVVARWCGELDRGRLVRGLSRETAQEADEPEERVAEREGAS
jgi:hypothetical protein